MSSTDDSNPLFQLKGSAQKFHQRQQDIFGSLITLETHHEEFNKESEHERSELEQLWKTEDDDNAQSDPSSSGETFRRPKCPLRHRSSQQKHNQSRPHTAKSGHNKWNPQDAGKWTQYSLSDVKEMGERDNCSAAFSFLRERQEARLAEMRREMEEDQGVQPARILFRSKTQRESRSSGDFASRLGNQPTIQPSSSACSKRSIASVSKSEESPEVVSDATAAEGAEPAQESHQFVKKPRRKNIRSREQRDDSDEEVT